MNIDIRKSIINNFKNSSILDIKQSIEESIKDNDDITLPGMGVFFELLWENINDNEKDTILNSIYETIKKTSK